MSLCSLNSSELYTKNHTVICYQKLLLMMYQFTNLLGSPFIVLRAKNQKPTYVQRALLQALAFSVSWKSTKALPRLIQ